MKKIIAPLLLLSRSSSRPSSRQDSSTTINNRRRSKHILLVAAALTIAGCSTVGYYSQIVSGHMRIVMGKRPVSEIVSDETVNEETKNRLQVAQEARQFAIEKLGLPNNNSYTTFYDTGRDYVTYNVVAADEFSFNPRTWCFPIAGCVSYRGYYAEEDADGYAEDLADGEGLDVAVNGATAYSTLGWFKDPLLNTMLTRSDPSIASLLFHELAHQQLYVGDDSTFNESFATFVETEGLRQWLQHMEQKDPAIQNSEMAELLSLRIQRREDFINLLQSTKENLETLYDSSIAEEEMRAEKALRFNQMREEYAALRKSWGDYGGYDRWFSRELNNARLVAVGTYNDYIPAFEVMFKQTGSSFENFYARALEVSDMPAEERTNLMEELLAESSALSQ